MSHICMHGVARWLTGSRSLRLPFAPSQTISTSRPVATTTCILDLGFIVTIPQAFLKHFSALRLSTSRCSSPWMCPTWSSTWSSKPMLIGWHARYIFNLFAAFRSGVSPMASAFPWMMAPGALDLGLMFDCCSRSFQPPRRAVHTLDRDLLTVTPLSHQSLLCRPRARNLKIKSK